MSGDIDVTDAPGGTAKAKAPARGSRRRAESRRRLLAAARKLFVERGYHDTRPQDIAREAEVGHGTFYLHFADKKDCFLAFVDQACDELNEGVDAALEEADSVRGMIRGVLNAIFDYADRNPGVLVAAMSNSGVITSGDNEPGLMDRWGDQWAEAIQRFMDKGLIRTDYDAETVGHGIIGFISQGADVITSRGRDRDRVVDNLERFLVNALEA
jgi:AcrR family transcriptional regulator